MSGETTILPAELAQRRERGKEMALLRASPGYAVFLSTLRELRGLNYLDILNSPPGEAMILAVGEARALNKLMGLVDEVIQQADEVVTDLDVQVEQVRARQAASFRPRVQPRGWRPADNAAI